MSKRLVVVGVLIALTLGAAVAIYFKPAADPSPPPPAASDAAPFAKSLVGTAPDGAIGNGRGELVLNEGLIERFDYYLSTMGERSLAEIRAEIERAIDKDLNPAGAAEAKRLFGRYLDFRQAIAKLEPVKSDPADVVAAIRQQRENLIALRSRFFSPAEIAALFGANDLLDNDAFKRLEINKNPHLSAAQKKDQLAELDARLPAQVREGRAADAKHQTLVEAETQARIRGASDAELMRIRTEIVGAAAAERLAQEDREDAAWRRRIDAYLSEKAKIMAFAGMAEADRQAEVQRLRERQFNPQERLRLGAYE